MPEKNGVWTAGGGGGSTITKAIMDELAKEIEARVKVTVVATRPPAPFTGLRSVLTSPTTVRHEWHSPKDPWPYGTVLEWTRWGKEEERTLVMYIARGHCWNLTLNQPYDMVEGSLISDWTIVE